MKATVKLSKQQLTQLLVEKFGVMASDITYETDVTYDYRNEASHVFKGVSIEVDIDFPIAQKK